MDPFKNITDVGGEREEGKKLLNMKLWNKSPLVINAPSFKLKK